MGFLKGPLAYLLIMAMVLPRQASCAYKNCALQVPFDLLLNPEPEGSPLSLAVDISITGLTEVANSGGSFSVDVE